MFLSVTAGLSIGAVKVVNQLYGLALNATPFELGLLGGAQSVGLLFMGLPVGFMVERYGPRRLFVFGSLAAGLVYLAAPMVASVFWLIALCMLGSFFMPFRFVSMNSVLLSQLQSIGDARSGWIRAMQMTGAFLLGPMLAAFALAHFSYTQTYWLIVGSFVVGLTVAGKVLPFRVSSGTVQREGLQAGFLRQVLQLFRSGPILAASATEFMLQVANGYFMAFMVPLAIRSFHASQALATQCVTVQGVGFVLALFCLGTRLQRWGEARFMGSSIALAVLGLLILALAPGMPWLFAGAAVLGVGAGMVQLANLSGFARISSREGRGRVAGVIALVGPMGGLLGAFLGGLVAARFGLQAMFFIIATAFAVLGCCLLAWPAAGDKAVSLATE